MKRNYSLIKQLSSFIVLSAITSSVYANTIMQDVKITINRQNAPISRVLDDIEEQTGYSILVRNNDINVKKKVSVNADNKTIEQVLASVFKGMDVRYDVEGKTISIYKPDVTVVQSVNQQKRIVKGVVVDKNNEPVIGANVIDKGDKTNGTITDIDGKFTLNVADNAALEISFIGYKSQEIPTKGKMNLNIVLMDDTELLDEVVVVGYLTQKKTSLTGAVSNMKMEENLTTIPTASAANLLAGKMAGVENPKGRYTHLGEASNGKDTMTGHWEMMGIKTEKPFKTFTETGFPPELIAELEKRCGKRVIGNKSASGTEIIEELGEEEIQTGAMIVYTSADSVLQICGNEETFDLQNLYRCCEIAREITMKDEWRVGRVIARPYIGKKKGEFKRTSNRHDYALKPTGLTTLNVLKDHGFDVIGVGKIHDIFCGEGITETHHSDSSVHGMEQTIEICKRDFRGLCFVNLVDFDALWGHRRNVEGYGKEIEKFDKNLGVLLEEMRENDLLILTADHGNDPTYTGTDHTREYVPFIAYSKRMKNGGAIKDEDTFAVIGASVAENFGVPMPEGTIGHSVLKELM